MAPILHRALLGCATLVSLWAAGSARARAVEPIALQWTAPAGCPNRDQVLERIRKLAGEWAPRGAPLTAAATIERLSEVRFRLKLVVRTEDLVGQRDLEAATCQSLANAAAVHVALLMKGADPNQPQSPSNEGAEPREAGRDGQVTAASDTARSAPQQADGSVSETGNDAARESKGNAPDGGLSTELEPTAGDTSGTDASDRRLRVLLQAPRASLQFGPLPHPSFGVSIGGGVMLQQWRLIAAAHVWLQQAVSRDDQPTIRADVDRVSASLRVCRASAWSRFELAPCAKLSLEHVWARGAGADVTARTAEATWLAAGLGLQSRLYILAWWAVVADLDVELEAGRPEISIDGLGRVGKLGLTAFSLTLGSEWIL